ncbi:MAG: glucose 1-dehydrogenase [Syntrophomonadaceae bacterium]|nr:glucose 1-dehydrogenase [Syntrophomonadaceae bacterium]
MAENLFDLTGKVAIVTGGTKGLGYGMAKGLAKAGADIVIVSRTPADCERVAAEIAATGRRSIGIPTDVSKVESVQKMVDQAVAEMGHIDILVNNAGTAVTKPALDLTEEDWDYVVDLNLKGQFFIAQTVGKLMAAQKSGSIINIASVFGVIVDKNVLPYHASKAGLIHMTKALASEWARYGIRVNTVSPGYVITPMNEKEFSDPKVMDHFVKKIPQRHLGEIEDIVGAVVYFASDASKYATGSNLLVDGGMNIL